MGKKSTKPKPKKKKASGSQRICYERILPDSVDPERAVRRAMRRHMIASAGDELSAEDVLGRTRMALVQSKQWEPGKTIRCRFLEGSTTVEKKVESIAHQWEEHANIKFKFVKTGEAEIRIAFADDGSWSAVGRDALNRAYFPAHQPTMNYGWLGSSTSASEYRRVVLHEFGHALGCIHEHQSPKFDRKWDRKKAIEHFSGSPNFWTIEEIEHNVLKKYSPRGVAATKYDPKSIMLYMFDGDLFKDGKGDTNNNTKLSAKDIEMIGEMYR